MKWLKNCLLFIVFFECITIVGAPKLHALDVASYEPPQVLDDSPLMITGYSSSSSLDYVQIYNPTDMPIDMGSWRIEYIAKDGIKKETVKLGGWIAPHNYVIASGDGRVDGADFVFNMSEAVVGGTIRLTSDQFLPHDVLVDKAGMYQRKKSTKTNEYLTTFESTTSPSLYGGGFITMN